MPVIYRDFFFFAKNREKKFHWHNSSVILFCSHLEPKKREPERCCKKFFFLGHTLKWKQKDEKKPTTTTQSTNWRIMIMYCFLFPPSNWNLDESWYRRNDREERKKSQIMEQRTMPFSNCFFKLTIVKIVTVYSALLSDWVIMSMFTDHVS